MTIATGIAKNLVIASQSALGTPAAVNAASAIYLRRVSSTLSLKKETYQSNEMRSDRQISDFRHGVRSVEGNISGELSPGTYQLLMAAMLRKAWASGSTAGAISDVTAATTSGAAGTFTRASGSFLTAGFKIGDVVRWSGFAGGSATTNNAHNMLITALTATVMTVVTLDGVAIANDAAGDSVTCVVTGKKLWIPSTGHTDDYLSVEHNYSDIDISELFTDCKPGSMSIKLPATGMSTIEFPMMGLNMTALASAASPYFTAPTAATATGNLAAVNGVVCVSGTPVAVITGLDFNVNGNVTSEPVVGSNYKPALFNGKLVVTGNMTVFFQDATFRDYFVNETEVSIYGAYTTSNAANADFISFCLPRVKVGGADKDDSDKGIVQTLPFQALLNTSGGSGLSSEYTTMSIQDSTLT